MSVCPACCSQQDTSSKCPKESYANVCYTPLGLAYYSDWGTLRNTGNMMFLATLMGKYGQQVRECDPE